MRQRKIRLEVPSPCQENWEAMRVEPGGRHCQRCNHIVTDFSIMTDQEMLNWFAQHEGKVCGRYRPDQLNRDIFIPPPTPRWQQWLLMSGLLFSSIASSSLQAANIIKTEQLLPEPGISLKISLHHATETNLKDVPVLAFINGSLKGRAITDEDGQCILQFPYSGQDTLLIKVGDQRYQGSLTLNPESIKSGQHLKLELTDYVRELQKICVKAPTSYNQVVIQGGLPHNPKIPKQQRIKRKFKAWLRWLFS